MNVINVYYGMFRIKIGTSYKEKIMIKNTHLRNHHKTPGKISKNIFASILWKQYPNPQAILIRDSDQEKEIFTFIKPISHKSQIGKKKISLKFRLLIQLF